VPSEPWLAPSREQRAVDALDAISAIAEFIAATDKNAFTNDRKTRSAVERELLTISEACTKIRELEIDSNLPQSERLEARFPKIPWQQIRGLGSVLRHEYGRVDAEIIWNTIAGSDLAELRNALIKAIPRPKRKPSK